MGKNIQVAVGAELNETVRVIQDRLRAFVERWFPGTEVQFIEAVSSGDDSVYKQIVNGWQETPPDIVLLRLYTIEEPESTEHLSDVPKNPWIFTIVSNGDPLEFLGWEDDGHEPTSIGARVLKVAIENVLAEKAA